MKIAIIIARFYPIIGGGETYAYNLAQLLSKQSHDVAVITGFCKDRRNTDFNFKVIEVPGLDEHSPDLSQVIPQLFLHFSLTNYDIVHINNYMAYFLLTSSIEPSSRTKYIFTTHNTPQIPKKVFSTFGDFESEKLFAGRLLNTGPHSAIISVGKEFRESINKLTNKEQIVYDVHHGVSIQPDLSINYRRAVRELYGVVDSDTLLISTARFVRRKNLLMTLRALSQLPKGYKLLMTGAARPEGKETYQEVCDLIEDLGLSDSVILPERTLNFSELMDIYRAADTFVLTSLNEGFGLSVIEAMACKVPVIATDVPGPQDIVTNEVNALLVPIGDLNALTSAILRVSTDGNLRYSLVKNALHLVKDKYSIENSIQEHIDIYSKLISKN